MRTLHKTKKCLNCNQVLSEVYDYCPVCGQENNDLNVDFWFLLKDFLSNYFSLDSKFFRSIKPFFINPGYLTMRFVEGKRRSFANPVRLYIIISLLYFFLLNIIVSDVTKQMNTDNMTDSDKATLDSLENNVINKNDSIEVETGGSTFRVTSGSGDDAWPLTDEQWALFMKIKDDQDLTEREIVDSLHMEHQSEFTQYVVKQMVRVYKRDKEYLAATVVQNLSLMMFVMLPVFALILKLLYIRRKTLYINHLIHAIHMHSFAFLTYSVAMVFMYYLTDNDDVASWIFVLTFVIVSTYAYISFKRVYGQKWLKTLIKFWIQGLVYFYILLFALIIEISISFLIF